MRIGYMEIELRSELSAGTGDGVAGLVNSDIASEYGLPVIPAKRIKGCLLEIAKEMCDAGVVSEKEVARLFGRPGEQQAGLLHVKDAHLYKIPKRYLEERAGAGGAQDGTTQDGAHQEESEIIEAYGELVDALREKQRLGMLDAADVLSAFTSLRTRTAINAQTGVKADKTLRTIRVAKRGLVLRAELQTADQTRSLDTEILLFLARCVQGVRHMGLSIARGLGEVCCKFYKESAPQSFPEAPVKRSSVRDEEDIVLTYTVRLLSPSIFPKADGLYGSCEDWIPGSALLGALAGMYVDDYKLGQNAHEDADFQRIFLRGGITFGYAFPLVGEKPFHPCPASWKRNKNKDFWYDLAVARPADDIPLRGIKSLVQLDEEQLYTYTPAKGIRVHHARPIDRGIGHAVRDRKYPVEEGEAPEDLGQFFQYVSLSAGQSFQGTWRGQAGDVHRLLLCLAKRGNCLHLGRSRTAEYGDALFTPGAMMPADGRREISAGRYTLLLTTPMVLRDPETGRIASAPEHFIKALRQAFGHDIELEASYFQTTELGGYNARWRLPRPKEQALAAGSALILRADCPLTGLEDRAWGERTGEGCGAVRLFPCGKAAIADRKIKPCEQPPNQMKIRELSITEALLKRKQIMRQRQRDKRAGAAAAMLHESFKKLSSQQIHRLIELSASCRGYAGLKEKLEEGQKEDKKEGRNNADACSLALKFIERCKGQSDDFLSGYLENARLLARKRGVGNGR